MALTVATAGTGVARTAHYVTPTGASAPIQTLLLEPQRTNLCIRSEEFDAWTSINTCNVTANATTAPDGTVTADLLTATLTTSARILTVTFTGDGEKCVAVYLKAATASTSQVLLYDNTAATSRHRINVTWSAGVMTASSGAGAGTLYPVEALANGWYRLLFSATGVIAANTNQVRILPSTTSATDSTYAWGAQVENAIVPSSYIKTGATTVTRNADSFYLPFTAPPQQMTVYVRGVELGTYAVASGRYVSISSAASNNPRLLLLQATAGPRVFHDNGTANVSSTSTGQPSRNQIVELRGVLSANGAVTLGRTFGGAAEVVASTSAGLTLPSAWSAERIYVNGTASVEGQFAFTHVAVVPGIQTMAEMRAIAGVS